MIFMTNFGFGFNPSGVTLIDDLDREDIYRGEMISMPGGKMIMYIGVEDVSGVPAVIDLGISSAVAFGVTSVVSLGIPGVVDFGFPGIVIVGVPGKSSIWAPSKVFF